jgi:hypothetical protein
VSRAAGVDVGTGTVDNVTRSGKGKYLFALRASGSVSKIFFLTTQNVGAVLIIDVNGI